MFIRINRKSLESKYILKQQDIISLSQYLEYGIFRQYLFYKDFNNEVSNFEITEEEFNRLNEILEVK